MQICILIHSNLASQIPGLIIMLREKALWYSHTSFGAITKPQITFLRLSRDLLLTADVEGGRVLSLANIERHFDIFALVTKEDDDALEVMTV